MKSHYFYAYYKDFTECHDDYCTGLLSDCTECLNRWYVEAILEDVYGFYE